MLAERSIARHRQRASGIHVPDVDGHVRMLADVVDQLRGRRGKAARIVGVAGVTVKLDVCEMPATSFQAVHRMQRGFPIARNAEVVAVDMHRVRKLQPVGGRGQFPYDRSRRNLKVRYRLVQLLHRHPADLLPALDAAGIDDLDRVAFRRFQHPGTVGVDRTISAMPNATATADAASQDAGRWLASA